MDGEIPSDVSHQNETNALKAPENVTDLDRARAARQQVEAEKQWASQRGQTFPSGSLMGHTAIFQGFPHDLGTAKSMRSICLDVAMRQHPGKGADEIVKAAGLYYDFLAKS